MTIKNESGDVIRDAQVRRGDFASVGSTLHPGTETSHFSSRIPRSGRAEVEWLEDDGTRRRTDITDQLKRQPQQGAQDAVTIAIQNDGTADVRDQ